MNVSPEVVDGLATRVFRPHRHEVLMIRFKVSLEFAKRGRTASILRIKCLAANFPKETTDVDEPHSAMIAHRLGMLNSFLLPQLSQTVPNALLRIPISFEIGLILRRGNFDPKKCLQCFSALLLQSPFVQSLLNVGPSSFH